MVRRKRRSATVVECPYCGEEDELFVDPSAGSTQSYIEDCAVCCRPRTVHVSSGEEPGEFSVWLERSE